MSGCLFLFLQPRPENVTCFDNWRAEGSHGIPHVMRSINLTGTGAEIEGDHYQHLNIYDVSQLDLLSNHLIEEFLRSGVDCVLRSSWQLYKNLVQVGQTNVQSRSSLPPVVVMVGMTVLQNTDAVEGLNAWYEKEHIPGLALVPGWRASTRYTIVRTSGDPAQVSAAPFVAVHEWEQENGLGGEVWKTAVFTPWSEKILEIQISPMRRMVWSLTK